jgi:hypothetical protein
MTLSANAAFASKTSDGGLEDMDVFHTISDQVLAPYEAYRVPVPYRSRTTTSILREPH